MRKGLWATMFVWGAALICCMPSAYAGEVDLLIQKLVDKGVLSAGEGQELIVETREDIKKKNASGTNDSIPSWIQTTKIKGDFRLREEMINSKQNPSSTSSANENRTRIRMRLGVEAKPNDQMKVAVGIATGYTDPRSTNVTLGQGTDNNSPDTFKYLSLDYAYAQYTPFAALTLTGGKMKNPFWQPNDLIWDTDLNLDGVAVQWNQNLASGLDFYMNNGLSILADARTSKRSEPYMLGFQPGLKLAFGDNAGLNLATAYYQFTSVKERPVFTKWATNTKTAGGAYLYNYNTINPSAELTFKDVFGLPYLAAFGDFVYNLSAPASATGRGGYDYGVKFGPVEKVANKGEWQAKLSYDQLGRDAFLDVFPDSDRLSGKTNMKSYEAVLEYGLGKNTSLALDYYYSQSLSKTGASHLPEQVFQVDWNLKF